MNAAVCRARARDKHPVASLFELVREQNDTIDETTFVDDVTRSLASGHFLLLVVGDGIREGVERIAEYLTQSAGLRFTFGLVELAIFDMPEGSAGGIIVEPRVLAKTVEIERAVVRRADAAVVVEDPPATPGRRGGRPPIKEEEFYDQIKRVDPALPDRVRTFFQRCTEHGLEVTLARASFILHWHRQDGRKVNFGTSSSMFCSLPHSHSATKRVNQLTQPYGASVSLSGEAVKIPIATRTLQIRLTAAPRAVRGVPRSRCATTTLAVVVTHLSAALPVTRPILTSMILAVRKGGAVSLRARQDVVLIGCVAPAVDDFAPFGERRLLA